MSVHIEVPQLLNQIRDVAHQIGGHFRQIYHGGFWLHLGEKNPKKQKQFR